MKLFVTRHDKWVIGLLGGGLLFRSAIAFWLPPGFDEGYYYLYTHHPDWSYFDHPLMVAFTTGFGPWLTGVVSPFTIRLGTLLLHTGALLLLYLTSVRLFSNRAGLITLAIATLIPIFLVGFGVLTLPDSPLIFFWTATLYIAAWEFFPKEAEREYEAVRIGEYGDAEMGERGDAEKQDRAIKPWGFAHKPSSQQSQLLSTPTPSPPLPLSPHPLSHPPLSLPTTPPTASPSWDCCLDLPA
ncbi:ArnT family glycosyltransferase [Kovacikia minuta]|uniref:ArnT family glycosyltransferase n=1 Tax=Kovacikia minuta TaxID=2931930 RepID=UPI0020C8051B